MSVIIKRCSQCRFCKLLSEFHADKKHSDGKRSECKSCVKENQKYRIKGLLREAWKSGCSFGRDNINNYSEKTEMENDISNIMGERK